MLLPTPIRAPSQPIEAAPRVQLRRDAPESRQELLRIFGAARRGAAGEGAAVVQFGAVALGLARSQSPLGESDDDSDSDGDSEESERSEPSSPAPRAGAQPAAESASDAAVAGPRAQPSEEERQEILELRRRDREVRTHEQAHKTAGGAYAGNIRLSYQMGPDGKRYAVEGSVPIDVSPVPGDPAATLRKMEVVHRAAHAPASPSSADQSVAAQAQRVSQQARAQLAAERYAQARELIA